MPVTDQTPNEPTQADHAKSVQDRQLDKLQASPSVPKHGNDIKTTTSTEPTVDIVDKAQDKVSKEFVEAELTPDQYVERTEMAAKEIEGADPTPSEPEHDKSPEQK